MSVSLSILKNGVRVITDYLPEIESVAIGVWADVGTRHEDMAHNGVAHMVEHMLFKGTPTRSAIDIGEQIEDVGGQMNAYTSREVTAYYVHLLKEDAGLALDVISDMLQHATFPEDELEKERDVILQEIGMNNDTPDELIFDNYQETAYRAQALGAPILGSAAIVSNMTKQTLQDYVRRFYTPSRLVVSCAGGREHEEVVKMAEDYFAAVPKNSSQNYEIASYTGGEHRMEKDLEQSHVVLGFKGVSKNDDRYYAAQLLSTLFGGGMSSRLFQEVREKRGLVYTVYSSHTGFHDCGQMEIYAGTGPEKLKELMPVFIDEIQKLMQESVSESELSRAKAQIRAGILMSRESMMSRANRQAKHLINFGMPVDIQAILEKVEAVRVEDIRQISQTIFSGLPTLAGLGPLKNLDSLDTIQHRLAA